MASVETVFSPFVLMIDNETLSTRPDAYVTQAGYVVGNVATGAVIGTTDANLMLPEARIRAHIDIETIQWWSRQSDAVRSAVFDPGLPAISPWQLYDDFKTILESYGPGMTVWASPAMFDLPQLTMAWKGKKPWKYSQERDLMTLYKMHDPRGMLKPSDNGALHHVASADALFQFKYLCRLVQHIAAVDPNSWAALVGQL